MLLSNYVHLHLSLEHSIGPFAQHFIEMITIRSAGVIRALQLQDDAPLSSWTIKDLLFNIHEAASAIFVISPQTDADCSKISLKHIT